MADQEIFSLDPIDDEPKAPDPESASVDQPPSGEVSVPELFSLDPIEEPAGNDGLAGNPPAAPQSDTELRDPALFSLEPLDASAATAIPPDQADKPAEPQDLVRQGIRISSLRLLFDFASTSQLSEPVPITPLPAMPHGLRGLASLHGQVLPVFDLASLLGIPRTRILKEMLLVVGHGDSAAAIAIDGLPDRFRLSHENRADYPEPPPWLADCVLSGYAAGGEAWLDIDHHCLLDKLEASLRAPRA